MDALGPDIHQLYLQLLSGDANAAQAPFFQPTPPPQAPMLFLGGNLRPVDPVPQPTQGGCAGNDFGHGLVPGGAGFAALPPREDSLMLDGDEFLGNDQFVDGLPGGVEEHPLMRMSDADLTAFLSDEAAVDSLCVPLPPEYLVSSLAACQPLVPRAAGPSQPSSGSPGLGAQVRATDSPAGGVEEPLTRMSGDELSAFLSDEAGVNSLCVPPELLVRSLVVYQPAMPDSPPVHPAAVPSQTSSGSPGLGCAQVTATDSPVGGAYQSVLEYSQAASVGAPQQVPDSETAAVAQMVHVAARCGDKPSTAWSVEEDQLLLQGLSRLADQDNVTKCLSIASVLAKKTVLDVAYRIRWLSDLEHKKKAAKEVQLGQEKSAGGNVTKGKGTKVANKKNNKHPLSKEVLDSRSAKDLIRDNNRLMDKIEEILRSGQVNNSADYFYYVKMNMDAMQNKVKDMASVMEGLSVGDEEWEDVLKDRGTPQAGEDAATPAP